VVYDGSALQKAATNYRLDVEPASRNAASVAPDLLLDRPSPVLFDEWQVVPTLWDQIRAPSTTALLRRACTS
jgi:hypothetical protein